MKLYKQLINYIPYLLRKEFKEKYIIIESDDWGLERALNRESIDWMKKKWGEENFSRWSLDSLESKEDLNLLFEVLDKYKNKFESPPVLTANFITHNFDYSSPDKLKFIPLSQGFNVETEDVRSMYFEGIKKGYIFPQLHGYSHYDIVECENYFNSDEGKESFNAKFFVAKSTMRSFHLFLHGEFSIDNLKVKFLDKASDEFEKFFGFKSVSFIPPSFYFDPELKDLLKDNEIKLVQASNRLNSSRFKKFHFPFFRKSHGFFMSVRNARLDPHKDYDFNHEQCIESIDKAFESKLPAVIDFHRVNFAGKYDKQYRSRTLSELTKLFDKIFIKWPEVKFIHTEKLLTILNQSGAMKWKLN